MKRRKAYPTLQAFLEETGTPQFELAKKANIGQAHLSLILSGERTPSLPLALKLARIANIPVETLVGKLHTVDVS
jgi:transcriptional regulator with XRE-family HTH domain